LTACFGFTRCQQHAYKTLSHPILLLMTPIFLTTCHQDGWRKMMAVSELHHDLHSSCTFIHCRLVFQLLVPNFLLRGQNSVKPNRSSDVSNLSHHMSSRSHWTADGLKKWTFPNCTMTFCSSWPTEGLSSSFLCPIFLLRGQEVAPSTKIRCSQQHVFTKCPMVLHGRFVHFQGKSTAAATSRSLMQHTCDQCQCPH